MFDTSLNGQRIATLLVPTSHAAQVLAKVLVALGLVTVLALVLAPWQQNIDGKGRIVALAPVERQQDIDAPIEGRITKWLVREGSVVKAGDVLFELTDNDPLILQRLDEERSAVLARRTASSSRVSAIAGRERSIESSRAAGIRGAESRIAMAKERSRSASQALEAAKATVITARLNLDRQTSLFDGGLTSQRSVELAQLESAKSLAEVERAQAALAAAQGDEAAFLADRFRIEHDLTASLDDARAQEAAASAEKANAAAELARLEVRLARQQTMQVKAQLDGTVLRLRTGQGNAFVKAGEAVLTLVPDTGERAAELWVDGNDMPLLSVGRSVRLQFEGWPAVQFTGWPSVAVGTFGGKVALIDAADDGTGKFRILVTPDEQERWPTGLYLRQGVRVNGWVLLDTVRLGYELWRRFNGFPPTVKPAVPQPGFKMEKAK